jgi:uncharacterized protein YceK
MKKTLLLSSLLLLTLLAATLTSCGDDAPAGNPRNVKFELTGTYTGTVLIAHTLADGGTQSFTGLSLPFTKEVVYQSSVMAIGFSGSGETSQSNLAGKTVTIKIYSNGKEVRTGNATADSNGILMFPTLTYTF